MTIPPTPFHPPLIKTKLSAPQTRAGLVLRPRLYHLLEEGSTRTLTLISAPPGYGKTTLVTAWMSSLKTATAANRPAFCWVSLDEADNDPTLFLRYLVAALYSQLPHLDREALDLLEAFPPPPLKMMLSILINALNDQGEYLSLVLDDYQCITNPAIQEGLAYFLERLPSTTHVILVTRSDPPLPLARLRVRNQLTEVRADALRFTPEEALDFLTRVMHLPVSAADITLLETRTEGWIAGLQMAALALQSLLMQDRTDLTPFLQRFSGSHRYVLDYLVEEVLDRQPEPIRNFLLTTAILERFCAPLCDALVGEQAAPSQAILADLERNNLFLIALDEQTGGISQPDGRDASPWFRYHHLFAELLRARLQQAQPERLPELHRRASLWFERQGWMSESIQHSLGAADVERTADLIERYGSERWSSGDPSILLLIGRLPAEMLIRRPRLGIYQAWIQITQGQAPSALALLGRLKARLSASAADPGTPWMLAVIELFSAYAAGSTPPPMELPDYGLIACIPAADLGLRSTADFLYAILLNRQGAIQPSTEILLRSLQQAPPDSIVHINPMRILLLARNRMMLGQLHETAELCQQYLEGGPGQSSGLRTGHSESRFYATGSLNILFGEVLYEWDELERAEEHIRLGIRANAPWQNGMIDSIGYANLVGVQIARGYRSGALETMRQLEGLLQGQSEIADLAEELETIRVRLWLANGELERVNAWADQVAAREPADTFQGWQRLTLARVRAFQERYGEAQQILEELSRQPGAGQRVHRQIRIDLLLGIVFLQQNRAQRAFQALEACLAQTQPGGYCRVFLDSGAPAQALLLAYQRSPAPKYPAYVRKLLEAFPGAPLPPPIAPTAGMVERLTQRELEVLRLMAAGSSNRQIAESLFLSEGTVKFYVHGVLEKMGVHSRTQAIRKAKELQLI